MKLRVSACALTVWFFKIACMNHQVSSPAWRCAMAVLLLSVQSIAGAALREEQMDVPVKVSNAKPEVRNEEGKDSAPAKDDGKDNKAPPAKSPAK